MLEAIPLTVTIWDGEERAVDLEAEDPAMVEAGIDAGRRFCIAARRAGGRCTAVAPAGSLLCNAHSGRLDSSAGGRALATYRREARERAELDAAARRLGTRAVVAATLDRQAEKVQRTVTVLLDMAADGDKDAAKALIPWLNQGLGMPTERVQVSRPESAEDLASMPTAQLRDFVAERKRRRQQAS